MRVLLAAAFGVLTWTLLEYAIHRWLGHGKRLPKNPFGVEHVRHHAEGDYFAPTSKKLGVASLVTLALSAPAMWALGRAPGGAYVAGLMVFYGIYEVLHRREHTHPGFGPYGRWARRHHFHHHFTDPRTNFGVTTPFWDIVFGTYTRPGLIAVPPKLQMKWLVDPETGDVIRAYRGVFSLAGARHRASR